MKRFALYLLGCLVVLAAHLPGFIIRAEDTGILPGETYTQPKTRTTQVTAGVHDNEPPSTPLLIAPADTAILATNTPTFVWQAATDNIALSHYSLVLDGTVLYSSIPLSDTTNSQFTLTYSSTTHEYSLVPKEALTEGEHSWSIIAFDVYDNQTSSVTWKFTVDTVAPVFTISTVDTLKVTITTQDLSTIPETALAVTVAQPLLSGTGEAGSTVHLTVRTANAPDQVFTFTIAANGTWEQKIDTIPRDQLIHLDFIITDSAGNISALEDVPLILKSVQIVIPLPPEIPILPPEVSIPVISAVEIKEKIVSSSILYAPPTIQQLATTIGLVRTIPGTQKIDWTFLAYMSLCTLGLHLVLKVCILMPRYTELGWFGFLDILRVLGLAWDARPQGIVIDSKTQGAVPFCKISISGQQKNKTPLHKSIVTNKQGVFFKTELPEGEYVYTVVEEGFVFPTLTQHPLHLDSNQYYQGSTCTVSDDARLPGITIPVDSSSKPRTPSLARRILQKPLLNTSGVAVNLLLVLVAPSLLNAAALSFYCLLYLTVLARSRKKKKQYTFSDTHMLQKENSVVYLYSPQKELLAVQQTSKDGSCFFERHDTYTIEYVDTTHTLQEDQSVTTTSSEAEVLRTEPAPHTVNFA